MALPHIISISAVHKIIGKRATVIYLAVIAIGSLILGYLLNLLTNIYGFANVIQIEGVQMLPLWLKIFGSVVLLAMRGWYYVKIKIIDKNKGEIMSDSKIVLSVEGMTCNHCSGTVQKTLEAIEGLTGVSVDLEGKKASFVPEDDKSIQQAIGAINSAGFKAGPEGTI